MPSAAGARRSPLSVLFLTVFVDLMGFGIVIPLLARYAERLHASPFEAGLLLSIYSLMQLVFAPIWGAVSDRIGRRPVILVSLATSGLSYLLLGVAWSFVILFVARLLAGIGGANISVAQAYIADTTSERDRARGMGVIGAAFGLGMVIGPAIGAGLEPFGPRLPEFFAAGVCLANFVLAWFLLPESLPAEMVHKRDFRHPLSRDVLRAALAPPGAGQLLALFFLVTFCFAVLEGTFSLAAPRLFSFDETHIYGLFFYMGLVAVVVQGWLLGRLNRRVPEQALVLAGAIGLAIGLIWLPFSGGYGGLLPALALVVGGQSLASPSLSSLISKTVGVGSHGEVLGVSQSLSAGARVLAPAGGSFILGHIGAPAPYVAASICAMGAIALALPLARREGTPGAEAVRARRSG
jgi:DHA1 family tetracycline resistance protein-like MFS transporter